MSEITNRARSRPSSTESMHTGIVGGEGNEERRANEAKRQRERKRERKRERTRETERKREVTNWSKPKSEANRVVAEVAKAVEERWAKTPHQEYGR